MLKKYISFDDKEFNNEQECIDHENNLKNSSLLYYYESMRCKSHISELISKYIKSLNDNFINELNPYFGCDSSITLIIHIMLKYNDIKITSSNDYIVNSLRLCDIPDKIKELYKNTISDLQDYINSKGR